MIVAYTFLSRVWVWSAAHVGILSITLPSFIFHPFVAGIRVEYEAVEFLGDKDVMENVS